MALIDQRLCGVAIDECDTSAFEQFVQAFHAALVGSKFVPLGGMHDGGADGFEERIYEHKSRASVFLQASKTADIEGKIRGTIKRLKDFGREPRSIFFYFSEPISQVDKIEEDIEKTDDVVIRIRAKQFIQAHINDNEQTAQSFTSYLRPAVLHLLELGASGKSHDFPFEAKTLCAFLGHEVNNRKGNVPLLTSVTDSLILWSLEETDPDKNLYMSKDEIFSKNRERYTHGTQIYYGQN
ncbi:MAG: hypothetical protein ACR650_15775 [Methylocystis sp.]